MFKVHIYISRLHRFLFHRVSAVDHLFGDWHPMLGSDAGSGEVRNSGVFSHYVQRISECRFQFRW